MDIKAKLEITAVIVSAVALLPPLVGMARGSSTVPPPTVVVVNGDGTAVNTGSGSITQNTFIDRSLKQYVFHWKQGVSLLWPSLVERSGETPVQPKTPTGGEAAPNPSAQASVPGRSDDARWRHRGTGPQTTVTPGLEQHAGQVPAQARQVHPMARGDAIRPGDSSAVPSTAFTFTNDTGLVVRSLYLWPTGSPNRGPDRFGDEVVASGEQFDLAPNDGGCIYDIEIELEESDNKKRWRKLDLCKLHRITLNVDFVAREWRICSQ